MKKCPYCAEEIQDEAIVCRYCGRQLVKPENPVLKYLGLGISIIVGLYGLYASYVIVANMYDTFVACALLIFAPFILAIAPLYALIFYGDWFLVLIVYGGGILGAWLYNKGKAGVED